MAIAASALAAVLAQAQDDPGARAPAGSAFVFGQACLMRLNVAQAPAAYAGGSDEIGRGMAADTPALAGVPVVDGADGRGCRVRYTGANADQAWDVLSHAFARLTAAGGFRTASAAAPDRLSATCVSAASPGDASTATRRATLEVARSGAVPHGAVTASLIDVRP